MNAQELLARSHALLLDFDGPVCSVFAGIPADLVANQLRAIVVDSGHVNLPDKISTSKDPFDIFRHAATLSKEEARYVEAAFTAHEIEAIGSAVQTSGAHEFMHEWHDSGRPLAIVSNNSAMAIEAYLDLHNLRNTVDYISARSGHDPALLKPNPHLLEQAIAVLGVPPAECTLVGDSITDIQAARAAGVQSVGYANKPNKRASFAEAQVSAIVDRLNELVEPPSQQTLN